MSKHCSSKYCEIMWVSVSFLNAITLQACCLQNTWLLSFTSSIWYLQIFVVDFKCSWHLHHYRIVTKTHLSPSISHILTFCISPQEIQSCYTLPGLICNFETLIYISMILQLIFYLCSRVCTFWMRLSFIVNPGHSLADLDHN